MSAPTVVTRLLAVVNTVVGQVFDAVLAPLGALHPLAGLAVVSILTAVATLLVVRSASDQPRIVAVKRAIQANLFECRLFQDDLVAVFRAQRELLARNLTYLRLSLVPVLWMAVPFGLAVVQLDAFYGYAGARVGQPVVVTAAFRPAAVSDAPPPVMLHLPDDVRLLDQPAWFPSTGEMMWRVQAVRTGTFELGIQAGSHTMAKALHASDGVARRSPSRPGSGVLEQLTWPSESPLEDGSPLSSISIAYEPREFDVFGWYVPWWVPFGTLVLLASVLLKKWLRVTL